LRAAEIYAEQDKAYLRKLLHQNRILPLDPAPPISHNVFDSSSRIVGMMGVALLQEAISEGPISFWWSDAVTRRCLPRFR
jgi:hypothetical protein